MISIPEFLATAPRHLFFTGKGGVGKTSLACASAVLLADKSRRVLLVSTDPASNLDAVLGTEVANSPRPVAGVPNLQAMNIDPEQATREYRERTVGPYRSVLPLQELKLLEERLSGACTVEVAAFDEFALLLSDPDRTEQFDHVIFDTAPTGHTLRLLELPAAWTGFLESAPGDVSCLGPLSGLKTQRDRYARTVGALADPKLTAIMLVSRPERVALMEAARTSSELRSQAMTNQLLVINGVFHATDRNDPLAAAFERRGAEALLHIPEEVASLPRAEIPLIGSNIVGLDALRSLFTPLQRADAGPCGPVALPQDISRLAHLIDELSRSDHGLVMVMGKGGVGKTTVAAAVAVSLAKRGIPVHLTTTDPAQHIWETLQSEVAGLRVSYIDPKHEVRQYRERMLESARATLSAEKLALFEEELKSPCYEEVAVFQAFSRIVMGARKELVVVDTAPTGHTLLLLDTAGAYHRQLMQQTAVDPRRIRTPLMLLQDPGYTKVLIVALPETTPVLEASALQDDLRRAQIEPFAWVINGSLAAAQPRDPVLRARAAAEIPQIRKVKELLGQRVVLIPFQAEEPVGVERLNSLAAGVAEHRAAPDLAVKLNSE
jgi:arsenite/tail-anchored protein-transporting ATPase